MLHAFIGCAVRGTREGMYPAVTRARASRRRLLTEFSRKRIIPWTLLYMRQRNVSLDTWHSRLWKTPIPRCVCLPSRKRITCYIPAGVQLCPRSGLVFSELMFLADAELDVAISSVNVLSRRFWTAILNIWCGRYDTISVVIQFSQVPFNRC